MRRGSGPNDGDLLVKGCLGYFGIIFLVAFATRISPIVGLIVIIVTGLGIYYYFTSDEREIKRRREAECQKAAELAEQNSRRIAEAKSKRHELLTKEDFIYLEGALSDREMEKLCIDAFKAGNRCAIASLLNVAERIIKDLTPQEVINECEAIIGLIPNARSFYYKGMALRKLARYDEAIVEIQKAIVIDQSEEASELRFLGNNLKLVKQELAQIKAVARRMHIEKEGAFNLVKTGAEYENFICGIIRRQGISCKRVGQAGDYGADVLATLKNGTLVIQCKFYSSPVGYDAVQQVYTAKSIYNGSWCCVVTNTTFTRQAIDAGRKLGVKLLSHIDIAEYLNALMEHC